MFELTDREIEALQGSGGEKFTALIDSLIYAQTFPQVPLADIQTNLRTTIPDGGVDAEVNRALATDPSGYLGSPTIWQYKATQMANVRMAKELKGAHAISRIQSGYAYRLCVADALTAQDIKTKEDELNKLCKAINSNAPDAKILAAGNIRAWAAKFPSVFTQHFRHLTAGSFSSLEIVLRSLQGVTKTYVNVSSWDDLRQRAFAHADFTQTPQEIVMPIHGEAGVGKTRFISELLNSNPNHRNLTVFLEDDESAKVLPIFLANHQEKSAIVVIDECSLETRLKFMDKLRTEKHRIRVFCVDNQSVREGSIVPDSVLEKIPDEDLLKVLSSNFPNVPEARRRAYAEVSEGFIRFAADMCREDSRIAETGLKPTPQIQQYYESRIKDDEDLKVAEAISLVTHIGYLPDVSHELDLLCKTVGIANRTDFQQRAVRLHTSPGFVKRGGRYLYVTPELVAKIAFKNAWQRWAASDPNQFITNFPASLIGRLHERVAKSAESEVRQFFAEFFRHWFLSLDLKELASQDNIERLDALIDTDPSVYFKSLRQKIESASDADLLAITGNSYEPLGTRRTLVWLAERLAAFGTFFEDAEFILRRLAINETENSISNNASGIWTHLFKIHLSGTEVPYPERLELLKNLAARSTNEREKVLISKAFEASLKTHSSRVLGRAVVGGKLVPQDWRPNRKIELECHIKTIESIGHLFKTLNNQFGEDLLMVLAKHTRQILYMGNLEVLQATLPLNISPKIKNEIGEGIEDFLEYDEQKFSDAKEPWKSYPTRVKTWLPSMRPASFDERLNSLLEGRFRYSEKSDEEQKQRLEAIARELLADHSLFKSHFTLLSGSTSHMTAFIGQYVGRLDLKQEWLTATFESGLKSDHSSFAEGYIFGLLDVNKSLKDLINHLIDQIEEKYPAAAYRYGRSAGEETKFSERAVRMVSKGALTVDHLRPLLFSNSKYDLETMATAYKLILDGLKGGDDSAAKSADDALAVLDRQERGKAEKVAPSLQEILFEIVEELPKHSDRENRIGYWWGRALTVFFETQPKRGAVAAVTALIGDDYEASMAAAAVLTNMSPKFTQEIIAALDPVLSKDKVSLRFKVASFNGIFSGMDMKHVVPWLEKRGTDFTRPIARHLPSPYMEGEKPVVPPITEFIFTAFENDDSTFEEFCAGRHSYQVYSGDIAGHHRQEAEAARPFLKHNLRRIREWAKYEIENAERQAKFWQQEDEERSFR